MKHALVLGITTVGNNAPAHSRRFKYLTDNIPWNDTGHIGFLLPERFDFVLVFGSAVAYIFASAPLATVLPLAGYLAVALLGPLIAVWLPLLGAASRLVRHYLYHPNPYIDVYSHTLSRHWLVRGAAASPIGD